MDSRYADYFPYQGEKIDHGTHVPGPFYQTSSESEYNVACTARMDLSHFSMLIHELLNKDTDILPEEAPLIILDSKSAVYMANNGKDIKHTRHISRRVNFVSDCESYKMHKIDWYGWDQQLADISTNNVGENYLNPRMKYIMLSLDNWYRTLVQKGWQDTG